MNRRQYRPMLEGFESRLVPSTATAGGGLAVIFQRAKFPITPGPPGVGTDQGTLAVLQAFSKSYLTHLGQPNYVAAFDLNHNGRIGQGDAKLLLRSLPPVGPPQPLRVGVTIAPQQAARGPVPRNSGAVTHLKEPTILGHTSPGALIFTGAGAIDVRLTGPVIVADANGNFSLKIDQEDGLNNLNLRAVDAYGQQSAFRAYPIVWLDFAAYQNAHPKKT